VDATMSVEPHTLTSNVKHSAAANELPPHLQKLYLINVISKQIHLIISGKGSLQQ